MWLGPLASFSPAIPTLYLRNKWTIIFSAYNINCNVHNHAWYRYDRYYYIPFLWLGLLLFLFVVGTACFSFVCLRPLACFHFALFWTAYNFFSFVCLGPLVSLECLVLYSVKNLKELRPQWPLRLQIAAFCIATCPGQTELLKKEISPTRLRLS